VREPETEPLSLNVADLRQRFLYVERRRVIMGRVFSAIAIGAAGWTAFELATRALGWTAGDGIGAGFGGGFLVLQYLIRQIPGL
jgi:hypothetical protein